MLAVVDRPDSRPYQGNLTLPSQAPHAVFRSAYRELSARIWIELELLAQAERQIEPHRTPPDITNSAALLRLELIVLVDRCRSPGWRRLLSEEQRDSLCSMLTDVLAALYVESEHLRGAIEEAQSRVLDELLTQSRTSLPLQDPEYCGESEQASNPAIDELLSLIEAQATLRGAGESLTQAA